MRIPFIAGNWKMFKTKAEAKAFAEEFSKLYTGTDVKTAICAPYTNLELLVELFKGTDALLHVSKISHERVDKPSDVLKIGDVIKVKVTEIDEKGRVNVSAKELLPKPEKSNDSETEKKSNGSFGGEKRFFKKKES